MKTCPNCGNEIEEATDRCLYCGIDNRVVIHRENTTRLLDVGKKANKKRNNKILLIEVVSIILIIIIYSKFFLPQIMELVEDNNDINKRETCMKDYNGTWDSEKQICHTEISDIEIK